MDFNYFGVKGHLFKKIENKKIYHNDDFHKKFYEINFFETKLKICNENLKPKDEIFLRDIKEVRIDFEDEADKNEKIVKRKRSNSLMNKIFGTDDEKKAKCTWLYEFILVTVDRTYVFRAPSREIRQYWHRIFSIIVEMNKEVVATNFMNPFDFD